jgi:hypothetical protein
MVFIGVKAKSKVSEMVLETSKRGEIKVASSPDRGLAEG